MTVTTCGAGGASENYLPHDVEPHSGPEDRRGKGPGPAGTPKTPGRPFDGRKARSAVKWKILGILVGRAPPEGVEDVVQTINDLCAAPDVGRRLMEVAR